MTKIITILVHIEECNGEQEYTLHSMVKCRVGNEAKAADALARRWYDSDECRPNKVGDTHHHLGGQVSAVVKSWQRVKPEHILILNEYGIY